MDPSPLWFLLAMVPIAASVPQLNIDLVVIPHMSAQHHDAELGAIKTAVVEVFPIVFELGPACDPGKKSRVALVFNGPPEGSGNKHEWMPFGLIDNAHHLRWYTNIIRSYSANDPYDRSLGNAIEKAREIFEAAAPSNNIRVIFVVTWPAGGAPVEFTEADEAVFEKTRKEGIQTYGLYQKGNNEPYQAHKFHPVTGHDKNMYTTDNFVGGFNKTVFEWLKDKVIAVSLCEYAERCFFQDTARTECKKVPFTSNMTIEDGNCTTFNEPPPPASNVSCNVTECKTTCDELWAITDEQCVDNCGKNVTRNIPKRWNQLEHCSREVECPACRTTSTPMTGAPDGAAGGLSGQVGMLLIMVAVVIREF